MCALLLDCGPEDEIIVPSFTFVSFALAFVRQGAKIVFADSESQNPNLDVSKLEALITSKNQGYNGSSLCGYCCRYGCGYATFPKI
jgi:dTDP-4-amino-4,6-dideoxygalactose transaminase